MNRAIVF
ncbi:hypothetical protein D046_8486, partial [Vibrio parahaemolyticus V-223/04]